MGSIKFIGAEFSWGKWNAEDIKALQEPLIVVVNRAGKSKTPLISEQKYLTQTSS